MPEHSITSGYLICGTPRTGSTLFCGLLGSTGVAGRPESYFRQPDEQAWADRWQLPRRPDGSLSYLDFVDAAITEGRTDNGVFGARVMWGTLEEMVAKLGKACPSRSGSELGLLTRAFVPLRFIHIWRDDTLAQAVSWARAEQTQFWQHGDTVMHQPTFDFDQIRTLVRTIEDHNAAWRDWFCGVGVQPYDVRYEDLIADPPGVIRQVLDFLEVQLAPDVAMVPQHHRQADAINADWIARYRRIESDRADGRT